MVVNRSAPRSEFRSRKHAERFCFCVVTQKPRSQDICTTHTTAVAFVPLLSNPGLVPENAGTTHFWKQGCYSLGEKLTVANLMNKIVLYILLSSFSGTRVVRLRIVQGEPTLHLSN